MAVASLLLALLVGTAFAVLLVAVSHRRASGRLVTHSREASAAADGLEELVIDLETGVRGFVIARWSAIPVDIDVQVDGRLPDRFEVARRRRSFADRGAGSG
jgi:hypothetical protein